VLHVPSSTYLQLDATADLVLHLLDEHGTVAGASQELADRFGISPSRAWNDTQAVLDQLCSVRGARGQPARRPSLGGMVATAQRWWELPVRLRLQVVGAFARLLAIEVGLRALDIRRLAILVGARLDGGSGSADSLPAGEGDLDPDQLQAWRAAGWVLEHWIWPATCLRRALMMAWVLRRQGPVLRLGLMADGVTAHAWLEAGGRAYGATDVRSCFVPAPSCRH